MKIYEVIYEDETGQIDHEVVTENSEELIHEHWEEKRPDNDIVEIRDHGEFITNEVFEELRQDIIERGIPAA